MVKILLVRGDGSLSLKADGHALFDRKGKDIVCAAVTVLARTAALTFEGRPGVDFNGDAPVRGEVAFTVRASGPAKAEVNFAADFLSRGFESLAREFPQNVEYDFRIE